jgi:hypothetical protein
MTLCLTGDVQSVIIGTQPVSAHGNPDHLMPGVSPLYPLNVAPNIDLRRVQRVATEMYQFKMLSQPFHVSTMLGGL